MILVQFDIWHDRVPPFLSNSLEKCCADNSDFILMEKWCLQASAFSFDRIIIKIAVNQGRHKGLGKFDLNL